MSINKLIVVIKQLPQYLFSRLNPKVGLFLVIFGAAVVALATLGVLFSAQTPTMQGDDAIQALDGLLGHPLPLAGKVIVLDPGHDKHSNVYEDYIEGVAMLSLAQKIKPMLQRAGATVHLTRETGDNLILSQRAAKINIWSLDRLEDIYLEEDIQPDDPVFERINLLKYAMQSVMIAPEQYKSHYLNTPFSHTSGLSQEMEEIFSLQDNEELRDSFLAISLHSNAMEQEYYKDINGADVYYIDNDMGGDFGYYNDYTSIGHVMAFGDILLDEIALTGLKKNSLKTENLLVLRETNAPIVLTENGYHSNDADRALLMNDEFLDRLATAYYDGIIEYFQAIDNGEI